MEQVRETELTQTADDGYPDAGSHLVGELRWLNRLLAAHVLRLRQASFYESLKDFRRFLIPDEEVDALLANDVFDNEEATPESGQAESIQYLLRQAEGIRGELARRVKTARGAGSLPPLPQLAHSFHLTEFETQALVICLAPQIDARYEKLYAYLQNDFSKKAPSVDLILGLLSRTVEERIELLPFFDATAPLQQYRLIESVENGTGLSAGQRFFRADMRILQYVLGNQTLDSRVLPYMSVMSPLAREEVVVTEELYTHLQRIMRMVFEIEFDDRKAIHLRGSSGVGKKTLARTLCGAVGAALAVVDMRALLHSGVDFNEKIRLIFRESLLQTCALYFDDIEAFDRGVSEHHALFCQFARHAQEMGWLLFLGSERPLPAEWCDLLPVFEAHIPPPDYAAQTELWERRLDGLMEDGVDIEALVARFDLTGGQIARAANMAESQSLARDSASGLVELDDLMAACRLQSQPDLGRLAQKVQPVYSWQDIVLPEEALTQLREICQRVRHRRRVLGDWGFASKLSQGLGVNALFAGPSGAGKTMAAEVIANELRLDLYKIDLAGVVSKYIGETEKNLDRIFTAAERSNAILFFDEADALFGKRSEVRDSHDRYANIEISYLLQKMEQYQGVAILATNLSQNLDEAFVRRLAFTVRFPFPDEANRLRIWQGIWPSATPIAEDLDLAFLARQFKLSGGGIKNAALAAAFLAAENGGAVNLPHVLQAIRREYQKMGKSLGEAELAGRRNHGT